MTHLFVHPTNMMGTNDNLVAHCTNMMGN